MSSSSECNYTGASLSSSGSIPKPSRRYEVGDEVELTVRVVGKNGVGCTVSVVGCKDALATSFMWPVELDAGRLKPRPIKVGDRVTAEARGINFSSRTVPGTVVAIVGEKAWIDFGFSEAVYPLSQLVKV